MQVIPTFASAIAVLISVYSMFLAMTAVAERNQVQDQISGLISIQEKTNDSIRSLTAAQNTTTYTIKTILDMAASH